eukprot:7428510-Heterocapsa_arctica.AAC.1
MVLKFSESGKLPPEPCSGLADTARHALGGSATPRFQPRVSRPSESLSALFPARAHSSGTL